MSNHSAPSSSQAAPNPNGMFGLMDEFLARNVLSYTGPCTGLANANLDMAKVHDKAIGELGRALIAEVGSKFWNKHGLPPISIEQGLSIKQGYLIQQAALRRVKELWQAYALQDLEEFRDLTPEEVSVSPELFREIVSLPDLSNRLPHLNSWMSPNDLNRHWSLAERLKEQLSCSGNHIKNWELTFFPESLGLFTKYRQLFIENCDITTLPESFENLSALYQLDISHTNLTTLPESFGNLKHLGHLTLNFNQLSSLPDSIGNLKSLEVLFLENNNLQTLPLSMRNLTNLRRLGIQNNPLRLDQELCRTLVTLRANACFIYCDPVVEAAMQRFIVETGEPSEIDLRGRNIEELPDEFATLTCLKRLDIRNNPLYSFKYAYILAKLRRGGCEILCDPSLEEILSLYAKETENVSNIDLSETHIEHLPPQLLGLFGLKRLDIRNTPLRVDDQLCKILEHLRETGCEILCDPLIENS